MVLLNRPLHVPVLLLKRQVLLSRRLLLSLQILILPILLLLCLLYNPRLLKVDELLRYRAIVDEGVALVALKKLNITYMV